MQWIPKMPPGYVSGGLIIILSTPCNGFEAPMTIVPDWRIGEYFQLHAMDSHTAFAENLILTARILSTPCNGFPTRNNPRC